MSTFIEWLYRTPLSQFIQTVTWIIPIIQSIHILCLAVLFTSMMMLDMRLLSVAGKAHSMGYSASRFLPILWRCLPILFVTGLILIIAEPRRDLANIAFYCKMTMLILACILAYVFQRGIRRDPLAWESGGARSGMAKMLGAASIALWIGIVVAGRLIAYV